MPPDVLTPLGFLAAFVRALHAGPRTMHLAAALGLERQALLQTRIALEHALDDERRLRFRVAELEQGIDTLRRQYSGERPVPP